MKFSIYFVLSTLTLFGGVDAANVNGDGNKGKNNGNGNGNGNKGNDKGNGSGNGANAGIESNPKYKPVKENAGGNGNGPPLKIDGEYIVLLRDDFDLTGPEPSPIEKSNGKSGNSNSGNSGMTEAQKKRKIRGLIEGLVGSDGQVEQVYSSALKGASLKVSDANRGAIQRLLNSKDVVLVEENQRVELDQLSGRQDVDASGVNIWGLDRVDQASSSLDGFYEYGSFTGFGVDAYIVDTGIMTSHNDFGGRATCAYSAIPGEACVDNDGHGTHVAGTIGGRTFGVAKRANLIGVKVVGDFSGSISTVIDGIDWVTARVSANPRPSVISMSLGPLRGRTQSPSWAAAIQNAINAGISYAAAAGNDNEDACISLSYPNAIVVGSSTEFDSRSFFSNFGSCVDMFAPGSDIWSAGIASNTARQQFSGTSMATPHVAGVMALYLQQNPGYTPAQVKAGLLASATSGAISDPRGTPNLLLKLPQGTAPPTPPLPPTTPPTPAPTTAPIVLTSGVRATISSLATGLDENFLIDAPAGSDVSCFTSGSTGDADLYVRFDYRPTRSDYDDLSTSSTSNESIGPLTNSGASSRVLNVMVYSYSTFSNLQVWCDVGESTITPLAFGEVETLSLATNEEKHYSVPIPANEETVCTLAGNNGDADLFAKFGSPATGSSYDYSSINVDSNEQVGPFNATSTPRTLYVRVLAFAAFTNVQLTCDISDGNDPPVMDGVAFETKRASLGLRKRYFFSATDPNGDALRMSLVQNDDGMFQLRDNGNGSGELLFTGSSTAATFNAKVRISDRSASVEYQARAVVFCGNVGTRCNRRRKCCNGLVCNSGTGKCEKPNVCRLKGQRCNRRNRCCKGKCVRKRCRR